jgi:hypothetical protein
MGYDTNNKKPNFGNKTALSRDDCHQLPEAPPPPEEPPPPEKLELLEKLDLPDPPELPDETVNPPMEARPLVLNPSSKVSLNILRIHQILRVDGSFHTFLLRPPISLIQCY